MLKIESDQSEEKLDGIKQLAWLHLSAETLSNNYKVKISSKKAQISWKFRSAPSQIVAAAIQQ